MGAVIGGAIGSVIGGTVGKNETKEVQEQITKPAKGLFRLILGVFSRKKVDPKKIPHEDVK